MSITKLITWMALFFILQTKDLCTTKPITKMIRCIYGQQNGNKQEPFL